MNPRNKKLLYLTFLVLGMLLLSGCTANLITDIKADGSGTFTEEFIMTVDELASYEMEPTDTLCSEDLGSSLTDLPPGATVRQEQNGDEITCIYEVPFNSLDELRTMYTEYLDTVVNDLRLEGGKLYYDVTVDMGTGEDNPGFLMYWIVKMPGSISEHNATDVTGNTLTWELPYSGQFNATATSNAGGISSTVWWIIGIAAFCLCLIVLVAVIVVVIILVRRKKKQS